jgi:uncharacterized membrane protein
MPLFWVIVLPVAIISCCFCIYALILEIDRTMGAWTEETTWVVVQVPAFILMWILLGLMLRWAVKVYEKIRHRP